VGRRRKIQVTGGDGMEWGILEPGCRIWLTIFMAGFFLAFVSAVISPLVFWLLNAISN